METLKTVISEQEIPNSQKVNTNEQVLLLTLNREWTDEENIRYLSFRKKEKNNFNRKPFKNKKNYRNKKKHKERKEEFKERKEELSEYSKPVRDVIHKTKNKVWWNIHHLVPRALKWSEHQDNKYPMKITAHEWLNAFIWNKLLPYIIMDMLIMHKPTMYEKTRDEIIWKIKWIMREYIEKWEFFNEKCFKWKQFIPKTL